MFESAEIKESVAYTALGEGKILHLRLEEQGTIAVRFTDHDHVIFFNTESGSIVHDEFLDLIRMLITYMMEDPRTISEALNVIWAARALERIGDHAKNIGEYVIYLVKGKDIRHLDLDQVERDILS